MTWVIFGTGIGLSADGDEVIRVHSVEVGEGEGVGLEGGVKRWGLTHHAPYGHLPA